MRLRPRDLAHLIREKGSRFAALIWRVSSNPALSHYDISGTLEYRALVIAISRGADRAGRDMRYHLANDRLRTPVWHRPVNVCSLIWTGSIQRCAAGYTWDPPADCLYALRHIQSVPAEERARPPGRLRALSFSLCSALEYPESWRSSKLAVDRIEGKILEI